MNLRRLLSFFPVSAHDRVINIKMLSDQMLVPQIILNELVPVPVNIICQSIQNSLQLSVFAAFRIRS